MFASFVWFSFARSFQSSLSLCLYLSVSLSLSFTLCARIYLDSLSVCLSFPLHSPSLSLSTMLGFCLSSSCICSICSLIRSLLRFPPLLSVSANLLPLSIYCRLSSLSLYPSYASIFSFGSLGFSSSHIFYFHSLLRSLAHLLSLSLFHFVHLLLSSFLFSSPMFIFSSLLHSRCHNKERSCHREEGDPIDRRNVGQNASEKPKKVRESKRGGDRGKQHELQSLLFSFTERAVAKRADYRYEHPQKEI